MFKFPNQRKDISIPLLKESEPQRFLKHRKRLISRTNPHKFNVIKRGIPSKLIRGAFFHYLLDLTWWKLFLGFAIIWIIENLIFASFYFIDSKNGMAGLMDDTLGASFMECFFFSVSTMETIGFGRINPISLYTNIIMATQAYMSMLQTAVIAGFAFAKISRPSRLTRQIIFSNVAVIKPHSRQYLGSVDKLQEGSYGEGSYPVIQFRIANTRKSQLSDPQFRLLLLRQETLDGKPWTDDLDQTNEKSTFRVHELNYELYEQRGRIRGTNLSVPFLCLPWTIHHVLDPSSPLFSANIQSWDRQHFELIAILDGIDEAVSNNFQSRWSYLPHEIIWDMEFVDIVSIDPASGNYVINYKRFQDIVPCGDTTIQ